MNNTLASSGRSQTALPAERCPDPKHLVQAVVASLSHLSGTDRLEDALSAAMGVLGEALQIDRFFVVENRTHPQTGLQMAKTRHAWLRSGPAPDTAHELNFIYEPDFTDMYRDLAAGHLMGDDAADFTPDQRKWLAGRGVLSCLFLPILLQRKFWGFVAFEDVQRARAWGDVELSALIAWTAGMGAALIRQTADDQLRERDRLLHGVARATQELLTAPDFDTGLQRALAALGEAANMDRVYILENSGPADASSRRVRVRYIWTHPHRPHASTPPNLREYSYDDLFPRWHDILSAGRSISGRVLDLFSTPPAVAESALHSILLVPIFSEQRFWGVVGFDEHDITHTWSASDEYLLNAVAVGIGGAIARQKVELALRLSEEHFRSLIENATDLIAVLDVAGAFTYLSPSSERILGYPPSDLLGRNALDLLHEDDARMLRQIRDVWTTQPETIRTVDFRVRHRNGQWRVFEGASKAVMENDSRRYIVNARDITDRRRTEDALRQSADLLRHAQKMEAVGRLAGGVAHDFNNLLTAIMGYGEILLEQMPPPHTLRHDVEEICRAADRAHALTRQLLAFSRKQVLESKVINLNAVVLEVQRLLLRLIGEDIELTTDLAHDLKAVRVDPSQMEQVVINLVVNARDAMPEGGRITLRTAQVDLREPITQGHQTVPAGSYVTLSVSDTGHGMDEDVIAHLFEPFFTTKEVGKGTGLGLSTVYGIMEQSHGHILVHSTPGRGACFTLYLPRVEAPATDEAATRDGLPAGGHETILLVEDEDMVRDLTARVLRERGYCVLVAASGMAALHLVEETRPAIDLLLTDMVMPQIGGRHLARRLQTQYPALRVLLMSGYAEGSASSLDNLGQQGNFLQKPFAPAELVRRVREVLDAR